MPAPRIFVSHSHADNTFGLRLIGDLRARLGEAAVWYDASGGLHGGDEWWNTILAEITARDTFLVILSPDAMTSKWVQDEMSIAWRLRHELGTRIIPILYRPCQRRADYSILQEVSFVAPRPYEEALRELLALLDVAPGQIPVPEVAPAADPRAHLAQRLEAEIHTAFGREQWAIVAQKSDLLIADAPEAMTAPLWRERGLAYLALERATEALAALERALDSTRGGDPYDIPTLRAKVRALLLAKRPADAQAALDRAFAVAPLDDVPTRLDLLAEQFALDMDGKRYDAARKVCSEALRLAPNDATWQARQRQAQLGPLHEQYDNAITAKHWPEALTVCSEALRIAPDDATWQARQASVQQTVRHEEDAQRQELERRQREEQAFLATMLSSVQRVNRTFAGQIFQGHAAIVPPLCDVPAGAFLMGSDRKKDSQAFDQELPQHTVTLGAYQVGMYPVTVAEYACAVRANAVREPPASGSVSWQTQVQRLDHPVVCVSWQDALAYARWLASATGQLWCLSTEAEWEKAARGTDGRLYPWGNQWDKARANTNDGGGPGTTTPVGMYAGKGDASPYGIHDATGNVWEWCSSLYQSYPYNGIDGREKLDSTGNRVLRGGSWVDFLLGARAACRTNYDPVGFSYYIGFRLASGVAGSS